MDANLAAALAIIEALDRLAAFEPFITRTTGGDIVAIWMDDDGELHQESVYSTRVAIN